MYSSNVNMTIVSDKQKEFRDSVARSVDGQLKSIANIQAAVDGFANGGWVSLKNPKVLLLPSFTPKHVKAYKQFTDVCSYYFGDSNFFNMCIRMAEIGTMKAGGEHALAQAKRQAMMKAFKRVQDCTLFYDLEALESWVSITKLVEKKQPGFETHLAGLNELVNAAQSLLTLLQESLKVLTTKMGVQALVDDMVIYHEKVNDQAEEAIMS